MKNKCSWNVTVNISFENKHKGPSIMIQSRKKETAYSSLNQLLRKCQRHVSLVKNKKEHLRLTDEKFAVTLYVI